MYKISFPVTVENTAKYGKEAVEKQLRRFDTNRVFLDLGSHTTDLNKRNEVLENLKEQTEFFKKKGYEVGSWNWTFMFEGEQPFVSMTGIHGKPYSKYACPADENFVKFSEIFIKQIASCGVDLIMFDDDFRYGHLGTQAACLCENHVKIINKILGKEHTREELFERIANGGKNKYRDAFLKANKQAFENFSKRMRAAVDEIDPDIRIGACTCMSSFDLDGLDAFENAKILAGKTKPFLRLIGAPYWSVGKAWGNTLQDAIELERLESSWNKNKDIEIMAEGDTYPRPRINCPASYLEGFDTAIRASGVTDGILKYGMDYTSNPTYETGYAKYHERNRSLYEWIDKNFSSKKHLGVRVFEVKNKIANAELNGNINNSEHFFPLAARLLANNTIPTVYEGNGIGGICFGNNAKMLTDKDIKGGLILDIAAAKILTEEGIDVGIMSIGEKKTAGEYEHFVSDKNRICTDSIGVYKVTLNPLAEILSYTETDIGDIPMTFRYKNSAGDKFFILNAAPYYSEVKAVLYHMQRSKQLAENIKWLTNTALPAYCHGHPKLYIQTANDKNSLTVGLWNFFDDPCFDPVVELSESFSKIEIFGAGGELFENKVVLSDIAPYSFVGFTVYK